MSAGYPCPTCGSQLQWVAQYNQYFCPQCQRYIPVTAPPQTNPVDDFLGGISRAIDPHMTTCPYCGRGATFNAQYNRWYCYNCQRWL